MLGSQIGGNYRLRIHENIEGYKGTYIHRERERERERELEKSFGMFRDIWDR